MKNLRKLFWITVVLFLTAWFVSSASSIPPEEEDDILVGRISYVTGKLLRFVPEENDWVVTVKDSPFGLNDALYSEQGGKAEFIMPNSTMVRISGETQIQLMSLRPQVTEADIAYGMARFYDKSSQGIIKATTPFGFVFAPSGAVFDLYVGDESLEVIALKGTVDLVLDSDQSRYEVDAGQGSIIVDRNNVVSGEGEPDIEWDDWNHERDSLWAKRAKAKGNSLRYIPPGLEDEAYDLEENGRWEKIYYEGAYRDFWRPIYIGSGWRPYTVGRWSVYYGDNCWIPDEPFGYITHHYGSWVYINDLWYWMPPAMSIGVNAGSATGVGLNWYPGRVGWIFSGTEVGWFPLRWFEPYYCHHHWGRQSTLINKTNITKISINIDRYAYVKHAVSLHSDRIYGYNNYKKYIKRLDQRTIEKFKAAPVVDNRIISNFDKNPNRFRQTNIISDFKPQRKAINKIEHIRAVSMQSRANSANAIRQDVQRLQQKTTQAQEAHTPMQHPRPVDRPVYSNDAEKPFSGLRFDKSEIKMRERPAKEQPEVIIQTQKTVPITPISQVPIEQIRKPLERDKAVPPTHSQDIKTAVPEYSGTRGGSDRQLNKTHQELPKRSQVQPSESVHRSRDHWQQIPEQKIQQPAKPEGSGGTITVNQTQPPKHQMQQQWQRPQQEIPSDRPQAPERRMHHRMQK